MAEIVNLRRVKKQRQRQADADQAAANRLQHGRTKPERRATTRENARATRTLDAASLKPDAQTAQTTPPAPRRSPA